MRPMLAVAVDRAQQLDLVQLVVAMAGADTVQAAVIAPALVDDDIEAVEGPEQALGFTDGCLDLLYLRRVGTSTKRRRRDPVQGAVLVRDNQPALRIDTHAHP